MNGESRTINSIKNIITGFLCQFIQIILGFISRTVFIKFLASEYLGISGLFSNIISMLSLAELGIGTAIVYALYKPLADNNEKELAILMRFYEKSYRTIGCIIGIFGIMLMPFLNIIIKDTPNINENLYVLYCFYLFNTVVSYFYSYKNSIIIADQKNYISLIVSYGISIVQTILQILVLITTKNFLLYLTIQTICTTAFNIIISKIANRLYPFLKRKTNDKLDKNEKRSLTKNIRALMINKLSGVLVNNTDNIIMTYFSGLTLVGLTSNYTMLIGIINTILNQIFSGITASVGNLNAKEGNRKKIELFNIINFSNFWLYGFSSICIIVLINDVIKIWIGNKFILPLNITIILCVNFYMVGMQSAVWTFKTTMGLFVYGRYMLLITAALNLVLSIILGKYFGVFGIFLATAIARLLTNTWYDPYAVCKYGLKIKSSKYLKRYLEYLIILVITLITSYYLSNLIEVDSLIKLIIKGILCIITVNLLFFIFFHKREEFLYYKNLIFVLINKFSKKLKLLAK